MESYHVEKVSFTYPNQDAPALKDISFTVESGQFVALCGPSGCGKSTLLRQLKSTLAPHGERTGKIYLEGGELDSLDKRTQSGKIGFVMQNPDSQIVTDKVWHELAFGLESLGMDTATIRRRVAEMAAFFGIQDWFYKSVSELSGGQKQLLNLAAIMVMQPAVLLLDEPTSQLDPIAAADFLASVGRINRELGVTVIITEHRTEDVLPMADVMLVMENGSLVCSGTPREVGRILKEKHSGTFLSMPVPMRVWAAVDSDLDCPLTVGEGRRWLEKMSETRPLRPLPNENLRRGAEEPAAELRDVWFRYEKDGEDVLRGLSLKAYPGQLLAILGGNGAGKSTTLSLLTGTNAPQRGEIEIFGEPLDKSGQFNPKVGMLPQNAQALFVKKTLREDLVESAWEIAVTKQEQYRRAMNTARLCGLEPLLNRHPFDLSGGEQERAALAKVLLLRPKVLLLDEPTKGMDAEFKQVFAAIIDKLLEFGTAIIMVSHDIEFCAKNADRCALFFDGSIVCEGTPREFFGGNSFYTTAANRMARAAIPLAVTDDDIVYALGGSVPPRQEIELDAGEEWFEKRLETAKKAQKKQKLPLWRKILGVFSAAVSIFCFIKIMAADLNYGAIAAENAVLYAALAASAAVLAAAVGRRAPPQAGLFKRSERLPKRTAAAAFMILLMIPLTVYVGVMYLGDRKYYFIALLVLLEALAPFVLMFESRRPQSRELIIVAVLCAVGIAGRAAFFMIPGFKPVIALVIIAGVAFGGETGFLVGAVTMLVSDMMFGQGPWTPWQMFAMGAIGFLAGVLFQKGLLRRDRASLAVFGGISAVVIYGGIMNPAAAVMWQGAINLKIVLAYYVTGFPMDLVQAAATIFFLWIIAQPMLEKLDRVKTKYGLVE